MSKNFCSVLGWGILLEVKDFEKKYGSLFEYITHYNEKFIGKRRDEYLHRLYFHYDETVVNPTKVFISTDKSYGLYSENGQQYHIIRKGGALVLSRQEAELLEPFGDLELVFFGYYKN